MQIRIRAMAGVVLAVGLVGACSSSPAATGGGGASQAPGVSIALPSISIPPITIPSITVGGGAAGADVDAVAKALVPPNSSEVTRTTANDTSFVVYSSTESVDSLKSFYEGVIPKAGMQIISTTTIQGGIS